MVEAFTSARSVTLGALAVGVNHWRMSRAGSRQSLFKSLLFVDGFLIAALVWEYAFPDEGAVESVSTPQIARSCLLLDTGWRLVGLREPTARSVPCRIEEDGEWVEKVEDKH